MVLQETFFVAAAGFNEPSQYIALMASASFLLSEQKVVGSALSSRHPLDTGITDYGPQHSSGIFLSLILTVQLLLRQPYLEKNIPHISCLSFICASREAPGALGHIRLEGEHSRSHQAAYVS